MSQIIQGKSQNPLNGTRGSKGQSLPSPLQPRLLSLCPLLPFTAATLLMDILDVHPPQGSCPCCSLCWGFAHSRPLDLCSNALFSLNPSMTTPLKSELPTFNQHFISPWLIFLSSTYHFLICWIFCLFILFIVCLPNQIINSSWQEFLPIWFTWLCPQSLVQNLEHGGNPTNILID